MKRITIIAFALTMLVNGTAFAADETKPKELTVAELKDQLKAKDATITGLQAALSIAQQQRNAAADQVIDFAARQAMQKKE